MMTRDLSRLTEKEYDLLVIGGGAYGLFAAWDAALRGLSVVLLERGDFGHATSSNTLRVIHGGLRYLQHADLRRMRESIRERTTMMRSISYFPLQTHRGHRMGSPSPQAGRFGQLLSLDG